MFEHNSHQSNKDETRPFLTFETVTNINNTAGNGADEVCSEVWITGSNMATNTCYNVEASSSLGAALFISDEFVLLQIVLRDTQSTLIRCSS